ncbi:MAG: UDP-N-acetylmuramoyl-L-alanyl-D-glutamate--2,6-diaminopimelate ligase [Planctomycetota bacterium]
MDVLTLIENLGLTLVAGDGGVELSDLTDDSRRVTEGGLFVARDTGDDRWKQFAGDAIERGAVALVVPEAIDVPSGVAVVVGAGDGSSRIDQRLAGRLSARFFGEPAKRLKLIGITGTNGKTTVATLTQYLLNAAGKKCGLIGTVAIDHGSPDGPLTAELTTPGAIDLHRHFAEMVKHGCEACAMEVSSHALDQGRVDGLEFEVAVFTNLTQDHLDYHGTMENYAAAKAKLFAALTSNGCAVLNANDAYAELMRPLDKDVVATHTVTLSQSEDHVFRKQFIGRLASIGAKTIWTAQIEELRSTSSVVKFAVQGRPPETKIDSFDSVVVPVVGEHNVSNVAQAFAVVRHFHDIEPDGLCGCVAVPGRLEPIRIEGVGSPAVLVDYAHTPDALENVLRALRPVTKDRLIVVFGCGGDRDRTKRPLMAQAACGLADVVVLTSDNPRTEDPQQILDDAIAGVPAEAKDKLVVEIDRAKAIESAILSATANDTVLIAGKGHEDYQILGTEKIHFDDREQAAAALAKWVEQHDS